MLGLELDVVRKLELGVVGVILLIAGCSVIRNWGFWSGHSIDPTLTSWIEDHPRLTDPDLPAGPDNPYDSKRRELVTVFADYTGQLQFSEYPGDPGRAATISYQAAYHGADVDVDRAQWARLSSDVPDEAECYIVFYAYHMVEGSHAPAPFPVHLTTEQRGIELEARQKMQLAVGMIDDGMASGTFEYTAYKKVLAALDAYRGNGRNLATDEGKKKLAAHVMELGVQYVGKAERGRRAAIVAYAQAVNDSLTAAQQEFLVERAESLAQGGDGP